MNARNMTSSIAVHRLSKDELLRRYTFDLGWAITTAEGKRPCRKDWNRESPLPLPQLLKWERNFILRTGLLSGVVVVDCDRGASIDALGLPPTPTVRSGSGGMHFYFTANEVLRNPVGLIAPHVDLRADGAGIVVPPSVHPKTRQPYRWMLPPWEVAPAPLPEWIVELARPKSPPEPPSTFAAQGVARPRAYVQQALSSELERIRNATPGNRNHALNTASYSLGQLVGAGVLDGDICEEQLYAAALEAGLDARSTRATLRSGMTAGIRNPRNTSKIRT